MRVSAENIAKKFQYPYITDMELGLLLGGTADSRYSKIKRLLAQGKLIHIRRGLFCWTDQVGHFIKPHPFELAQRIYAPSIVSLESALSYHGLIPEAVYVITSACANRANQFHTPLGIFNYIHTPLKNFYTQVELINDGDYRYFMAKPWRAICDYVFCYKKDWQGINVLMESLRINRESLPPLTQEDAKLLDEYYHHRRLSRFLKSVLSHKQSEL